MILQSSAIAALLLAGCSGEARERTDAREADARTAARGRKRPELPPYRGGPVVNGGRVTGRLELEGTPPIDSVVRTTIDQEVCGPDFTDHGVDVVNGRPAGVIVWIDGIRVGKRLPTARRFELLHQRCQLVPRVQAVVAGGTLNVRSADRVVHELRFTDVDEGRTLAVVHANDAGEVVPVDRALAKAARLALRCDVHPWTRGWVEVFDHPYFATSSRAGEFSIDSVPPGRYRIAAWHPSLGTAADSVTVGANGTASITLRFSSRAASSS